MGKIIKMI